MGDLFFSFPPKRNEKGFKKILFHSSKRGGLRNLGWMSHSWWCLFYHQKEGGCATLEQELYILIVPTMQYTQ